MERRRRQRWREAEIPWRVAAMRPQVAGAALPQLRARPHLVELQAGACVSCGELVTTATMDDCAISGRCAACNEAARRVVWGAG